MPLSNHPKRILVILLAPVIVCVGYLAVAAFDLHWIVIAATLCLVALHAPAMLTLMEGKAVILPWYNVTIKVDSSPGTKLMAILGLMAPPYSLAFISLAKHISLV